MSRVTVSPMVELRKRLVNQSDTLLFEVRASQRAYWRLTSLDRFDGEIWSSSGDYRPADETLPSDEPPDRAAATISVLLVPLVIVAGIGGGFFFNVVVQGVSPGAYFGTATSLLQPADLYSALIKAFLFGLIAGLVACYKGMNCDRSPVGVGLAVKQGLVITFLLVFFVNYVITTLYYVFVPQKVG